MRTKKLFESLKGLEHSRLRIVALSTSLILLQLLAACAQEPTLVPQLQQDAAVINVTLTEFTVDIDREFVPRGLARFVITNSGSIEHNLYIEPVGAIADPFVGPEGIPAAFESIQAGDTVNLDYHFKIAGEEFQLGCHLPGHYEAGMVQVFSVGE